MLSKNKEEGFSFLGSPTENCQDEEQVRKAILTSRQMAEADYRKVRQTWCKMKCVRQNWSPQQTQKEDWSISSSQSLLLLLHPMLTSMFAPQQCSVVPVPARGHSLLAMPASEAQVHTLTSPTQTSLRTQSWRSPLHSSHSPCSNLSPHVCPQSHFLQSDFVTWTHL